MEQWISLSIKLSARIHIKLERSKLEITHTAKYSEGLKQLSVHVIAMRGGLVYLGLIYSKKNMSWSEMSLICRCRQTQSTRTSSSGMVPPLPKSSSNRGGFLKGNDEGLKWKKRDVR